MTSSNVVCSAIRMKLRTCGGISAARDSTSESASASASAEGKRRSGVAARLREARREHPGCRARLERERAGECQEAGDAERVEVAPPVERLAGGLLGTHVVRRAHEVPVERERARRVSDAGDAEVRDERASAPTVDQDVVRLDVAVHHTAPVRVGERPRDVAQHAGRVGDGERPRAGHAAPQCLALHVAHHEEDDVAVRLDGVHGHDVGVRQSGRRACLTQEALAEVRLTRERRRQQLDRHVPVERQIARENHDAHAAAPELVLDGEAAPARVLQGAELRVERRMGGWRHARRVRVFNLMRNRHSPARGP
jgi:hypothetical protein